MFLRFFKRFTTLFLKMCTIYVTFWKKQKYRDKSDQWLPEPEVGRKAMGNFWGVRESFYILTWMMVT